MFAIFVNNVNENPVSVSLQTDSIEENLPSNSIATSLSSNDPDASDSHTYQLVSGFGSTDNASFIISGINLLTTHSFDFETKNVYYIRLRSIDAGGLSVESQRTIHVKDVYEIPTTIESNVSDNGIKIYPNPAHDKINIGNVNGKFSARLYNILGEVMLETNSTTIDCSQFIRGVYLLKILDEQRRTVKIVLE